MGRKLAPLVLALVATLGSSRARGDLRGPRDVTRALAALSSDVPEQRARAADWLALHGPDGVVVQALLASLEREQAPAALVPVARALARRARPEDAARLLELEPRLRAPARGLVLETLAQLETPETDAWLVGRIAEGASTELHEALEAVQELGRARREALLPLALERLAREPSPSLARWVGSLGDERARAALLVLVAGEPRLAAAALDGLAELGPDPGTAARLRELGPGPARTLAFLRALAAAEPTAPELDAVLAAGEPELRAAVLEALVQRAPERALAVLGEDAAALAPADRFVVTLALDAATPALAPWLRARVADVTATAAEREAALDALLAAAPCARPLPEGPVDAMPLALARQARRCGGPSGATPTSEPASLHLRAIAGEDVRGAIRASFASAVEADRLTLAHAWLAGVEVDDGPARALEREPSAEVFVVLALAAARAGRPVDARALDRWIDRPEARAAALSLVPLARAGDATDRRLARRVAEGLGDRDPQVVATALRVARSVGVPVSAHACRALEDARAAVRRAAWSVLPPEAVCLRRRARIDPALRAHLQARAPDAGGEEALVLRVVGPPGASLPRVSLQGEDGAWITLRPPASGLVYLPGAGPAHVQVLLEPARV